MVGHVLCYNLKIRIAAIMDFSVFLCFIEFITVLLIWDYDVENRE